MPHLDTMIESLRDWFGGLDVQYRVVAISVITTLVVMIIGHKLRPWIGCKLGFHNWQFIDLQRKQGDFQTYGRVCWDDCLAQVWTSSGFVDRVEAYAILAEPYIREERRVAFVGNLNDVMERLRSPAVPYIVGDRSEDVIRGIMFETTVYGLCQDPSFEGKFVLSRGDLDEVFKCPTYRTRRSYELKRWVRRQRRSGKNWVKSRLSNATRRVRR